jgi:hypothetical protein
VNCAVALVASHFPEVMRLTLTSGRIVDGPPSVKTVKWERAIKSLESDADAPLPT